MIFFGVIFALMLLIFLLQFALYKWAAMVCSANHLKDYSFPGGGEKGLVPPDSLLVQQDPRWWGKSFINIPADKAGLADGASTGVYYRTWGPLWWTYTYQDIMSKETFVMRDRPLALGGSHKLMRCDGTGPEYIVNEGSHVLINRIRALFGMYETRTYSIWENNVKVAESAQLGGTGQSHKQIVFRKIGEAQPFASCFLKDIHFHGKYDEWFVQVEPDSILPPWVPNGITAMMAFRKGDKDAKEKKEAAKLNTPVMVSISAAVATGDFLSKTVEVNAAGEPKTGLNETKSTETVAKVLGESREEEITN